MKLAIVGSRSIEDEAWVWEKIEKFVKDQVVFPLVILSGGANGVDSYAERYAKSKGHDYVAFLPLHQVDRAVRYMPSHFFSRNKQLVDNADKLLILWDGKSRGTENTIQYAKEKRKPIMLITK